MKRVLAVAYLIVNSSLVLASDLPYKEDELLVRFAPSETGRQRSTSEKASLLNQFGLGTVKHEYKIVPGLTHVKLLQGQTVQDSVKVLNKANGILYAEPDYKIKLLSTYPNDPCFTFLWGLNNTGQPHPHTGGGFETGTSGADINAPEAWDIKTDSEIIVAVLDTGIDYSHPDLAANMWVNPGEIPGNGIATTSTDISTIFTAGILQTTTRTRLIMCITGPTLQEL